MNTNNFNTGAYTHTNNNSKEENVMNANNNFAQDCTAKFTFASIFYNNVILGEDQSEPKFFGEDVMNHRLSCYVATGDTDPDPDMWASFDSINKRYTSGVVTFEEGNGKGPTLDQLFDYVYNTVKSFNNKRLEMNFRRSYDWITTNIPTFRYTFLERAYLGDKEVIKVFCNKARESIDAYIDISFMSIDDDRSTLIRRADRNLDLLIMTNVTAMNEDDLLDIANDYAERGIALTFDEAYYITHPDAASLCE